MESEIFLKMCTCIKYFITFIGILITILLGTYITTTSIALSNKSNMDNNLYIFIIAALITIPFFIISNFIVFLKSMKWSRMLTAYSLLLISFFCLPFVLWGFTTIQEFIIYRNITIGILVAILFIDLISSIIICCNK